MSPVPSNEPKPSTADNKPMATACRGFGAVEYTYSNPGDTIKET